MDCGGSCHGCADGKQCLTGPDCISQRCESGVCTSCHDWIRNGNETDVDCGGSCGGCADGKVCGTGNDCQSGRCIGGVCVSCSNHVKDGDETDVDCGGSCPTRCYDGLHCSSFLDCRSLKCRSSGLCGWYQAYKAGAWRPGGCSVAIDSAGHTHVAYSGDAQTTDVITYATDASGAWVTSTVAGLGVNDTRQIALVLTGGDQPIVGFTFPNMLVKTPAASGPWATLLTMGVGSGFDATLLLDEHQSPWVLWSDSSAIYARAVSSSQTETLATPGSGISAALAPNGKFAVGFVTGSYSEVNYVLEGGAPTQVDAGSYPALAFAPDGSAHIAYTQGRLQHARSPDASGATWQTDVVIDESQATRPALAIDPSGALHLVSSQNYRGIYYSRLTSAGWQTALLSSQYQVVEGAKIAVGADGDPAICYLDDDTNELVVLR